MTTPDLSVLDGLSDAAFGRVLKRLSFAEKEALFDAITKSPPAAPHERLLWFAHEERSARFMARFNRLSVGDQGAVWLRLAAGEDIDLVLKELPSPASDDAVNSNEGRR
jgi:hypothetical protein